MSQQIEQIKEQIVQLEGIEKIYIHVADLCQKSAIAEAVRLQFASENIGREVTQLEINVSKYCQSVEDANRDLPSLEIQRNNLQTTYETLLRELSADPDAQKPEELRKLRAARSKNVKETRKVVDRFSLQIRTTLQEIRDCCDGKTEDWINEVGKNLKRWDSWASIGYVATSSEIEQALESLKVVASSFNTLLVGTREAANEAKDALLSSDGKLKALNRGSRITNENVAKAVELLDREGISCEAVAGLVNVTDIQWQGPIETFLRPHRLALLVQTGYEDAAVALIRRMKINDVTIIQPEHLKNELDKKAVPNTVAALLQSSNAVALAYLRRILGGMKCVETEVELRREARALTVDYMLSANGGTSRMRPLAQDQWLLGIKLTNEDCAAIVAENRDLRQKKHDAENQLKKFERAWSSVQTALQQVNKAEYELAITSFNAASSECDATPDPDVIPVPDRVAVLQNKVNLARGEAEKANSEYEQRNAELIESSTNLKNLQPQLEAKRIEQENIQKQYVVAMSDTDWEYDRAVAEYDRISAMGTKDIVEELNSLYSNRQKWIKQIEARGLEARDGFINFINDHSIELFDERNDWRLAHKWVTSHIGKLKDSTLANYENEAQSAREAAEQSFKSDVKFKMREAILRVRQEIRDLNKILETCPAFTNGEKYQFVANISPAHRSLYELIVNNSGDTEIDLFSQPETQVNIMALLEASESGQDKGNNPLEDYRLLFNFDLEIRQDGKVVDFLSKRMGVASNGEHRVPFYVIAGAALATAYRIRPSVERSGVGLMILDEAFYGMDAQNTFVTAEFLKSLGLQLLMAGPDSDVGKLAPLLDNYYDLVRYGADVFVEQVRVKEPARRLLSSDIPLRHQELLDAQEAQLIADAL